MSAENSRVHVETETMRPRLIDDYRSLSHTEYDNPAQLDPAHISWKHISAPSGPSVAVHLYLGGTVVGRAFLQPRDYEIDGAHIRAAFMTDLLIHPAHRASARNFLMLMTKVRSTAGFDLIFHPSNETSDPLFRNVLRVRAPVELIGFGVPLKLENVRLKQRAQGMRWLRYVTPLWRAGLFVAAKAARALSRLELSERAPDPQSFERLRARFVAAAGPQLLRNTEFLEWRFRDAPLRPAEIRFIWKGSAYCGCVVMRHFELLEMRFSVLMDAVFDPDLSGRDFYRLRMAVVEAALAHGSDAVFSMFNPKNPLAKRLIGFPLIRIPGRLLPHEVPMFLRPLSAGARGLEERHDLYFTLGDLDYF